MVVVQYIKPSTLNISKHPGNGALEHLVDIPLKELLVEVDFGVFAVPSENGRHNYLVLTTGFNCPCALADTRWIPPAVLIVVVVNGVQSEQNGQYHQPVDDAIHLSEIKFTIRASRHNVFHKQSEPHAKSVKGVSLIAAKVAFELS